jgi:hypothetical protein
MKRLETLAAVVILLAFAGTALADTVWDYADSYSPTDNSVGLGKFASGYLTGAGGTFNLFAHYSDTPWEAFHGINRWDDVGNGANSTDSHGNAGINTNATATEELGWGGGMYFEPGATTIMPGTGGTWTAIRWTAPADDWYDISARFTDQQLDGASKSIGVRVREGTEFGTVLWNAALTGFVGRAANDFNDATGTNQSGTYTAHSYMTAGQTLDFIVESQGPVFLMTGIGVTISSVPEPSSIALILTGAAGLLAYAWRRRR